MTFLVNFLIFVQKRYRMSTCHKPKPHKTKIQMHTKAAKLTDKSSFAEVQEAIADNDRYDVEFDGKQIGG